MESDKHFYTNTDLGDVSDLHDPEPQYRQMNLTEQPQLNQWPFTAHLVIHMAVLKNMEWYAKNAPEALQSAVDYVDFWGALSAIQPPKESGTIFVDGERNLSTI